MKIIALEHEVPGFTAADFRPRLKAEAMKVWELVQADMIRECYFRADQHTAVLMLECASIEEAHRLLNDLPLVRDGLIAFEVIPLAPYPGFSRLFTEER